MPANQPYPGETPQQFNERMMMANPAEEDDRTLGEMIQDNRRRNQQQQQGQPGAGVPRPQQLPNRQGALPDQPTPELLMRFMPRIGQAVPALRGPGQMVIGGKRAQMKYAQMRYQMALRQQKMMQARQMQFNQQQQMQQNQGQSQSLPSAMMDWNQDRQIV